MIRSYIVWHANPRFVIALLCALLPACVHAQIGVTLEFEHSVFLKFEPVPVRLTVENQTDQAFVIGGVGESVMLEFEVALRGERNLVRIGTAPFVSNAIVLPGKTKEISVSLSEYFDMTGSDTYSIRAMLVWSKNRYVSDVRMIDIVPGIEITSVRRSLPSYPDTIRVFSLCYWTRNGTEHLFLKAMGDDGKTSYGMFDLGPLLRLVQPEIKADISGNIEVTHQSTRSAFVISSFRSARENVMFLGQSAVQPEQQP